MDGRVQKWQEYHSLCTMKTDAGVQAHNKKDKDLQ